MLNLLLQGWWRLVFYQGWYPEKGTEMWAPAVETKYNLMATD